MPTAAQVIASAKHYVESGQSVPPGMCLKIMRTIAGIGSQAPTASAAYWAVERAGRVHEDANAPAGAFYYWTGGSSGAGHIAISAGNGYIYTTDYPQRGKVGLVKLSTLNKAWGNLNFRGWSDTVNGGRVTKLGKVSSTPTASQRIAANLEASSVKASTVSKANVRAAFQSGAYSKALIASSPELTRIYEAAVQRGDISDAAKQRFLNDIRNSEWYRSRAETQRQYDTLLKTDPKTAARNEAQQREKIRSLAYQLGVKMSDQEMASFAKSSLRNGLSDLEINRAVANMFELQQTTTTTRVVPGQTTTAKVSEFEKLRQAVIGQESGGDYGALGQRTRNGDRAYGRYQIMGNNIPSWTKKYLGKSMTPEQFLRDKKAQDKVATGQLKMYYDKYGAAGAAAAWYGGEGGARKYLAGGDVIAQNGPKLRTYVSQVLARMKKIQGTTSSTGATTETVTTVSEAPEYLSGDAGQYMNQIRDLAHNYGVTVSDKTLGKQIQDFLAGRNDLEGLESYYRAQAVAKYPQFAELFKSGSTLEDIAQPYVDQMAQTLELDPSALDWTDATVQKGLNQKDPKTGAPTAMPIWAFDTSLKKDARWKQTNNARESLLTAGRQVLSDMGLVN